MTKKNDDLDALDEPGAVLYDLDAHIGVPGSASDEYVHVDVPDGVNGSDFALALLEATGGPENHHMVRSADGGFQVPQSVLDAATLPGEADYVDPVEASATDAPGPLSELHKDALLALAKDRGVKGVNRNSTKDEILQALTAGEQKLSVDPTPVPGEGVDDQGNPPA